EPPIPLRVCRISSAVLSTTQPPLPRARMGLKRASIGRTLCSQAGRDRQGRNAYDLGPAGTWALAPRMTQTSVLMTSLRAQALNFLLTLALVGAVTAGLYGIIRLTGLTHGSAVYLIPVLIAGTRWGIPTAVFAAVCGVLASAFFFFEPLYSFQIKDPHEVVNLVIFTFTAVVVGQLANRLKRQLELARQREIDLSDLYAFSRRLAVAFDVSDIQAAIEDHLASVMQRKVVLFGPQRDATSAAGHVGSGIPTPVLDMVDSMASGFDSVPGQ